MKWFVQVQAQAIEIGRYGYIGLWRHCLRAANVCRLFDFRINMLNCIRWVFFSCTHIFRNWQFHIFVSLHGYLTEVVNHDLYIYSTLCQCIAGASFTFNHVRTYDNSDGIYGQYFKIAWTNDSWKSSSINNNNKNNSETAIFPFSELEIQIKVCCWVKLQFLRV